VSAIKALFEERYTPGELAVLAELLARLPGASGTAAEKQLTA
jgi:hypothetical protein